MVFGVFIVSGLSLVPSPPVRITAFINSPWFLVVWEE
jgi:hypothetical protein